MKCRCHFDMPIALKKHSQSLKTTLEEARTVGLELNKQADKQGMTIFISPELSAAIGGLSRSISVTPGESEEMLSTQCDVLWRKNLLRRKYLWQNVLLHRKMIQDVYPTEIVSNFVMGLGHCRSLVLVLRSDKHHPCSKKMPSLNIKRVPSFICSC